MRKILSIVACLILGQLAVASHIHAEEAAGTQPSTDQPATTNITTVVNPAKPHVDPLPHPHPTLTSEGSVEAPKPEGKGHGKGQENKNHGKPHGKPHGNPHGRRGRRHGRLNRRFQGRGE